MLTEILNLDIFRFFLIFARLGAAFMLLPGIGGRLVATRIRLMLALTFAFLMLPVAAPVLPPMPKSSGTMILLLVEEATIGVFLGLIVQVLLSALNITGTFVGFQVGLASALVFDPVVEQQSQILTGFLANLALVVIFATDLHHLIIRAVADSYALFPPGQPVPFNDFAETLAHTTGAAFRIGIQLAAPLMAFGLVFFAGMGLLSRLVPQMQVFFVAMPVQLLVGLWLFMVSLPAVMLLFLRWFEDSLVPYALPR